MFLTFGVLSCVKDQTEDPFEVLPKPTRTEVVESGFKSVNGVDVEMYSKTINNVKVAYQFEHDRLLYKIWWLKIDTIALRPQAVKSLLSPFGLVQVTPIAIVNDINNQQSILFCVLNKNHDTLICKTTVDENHEYHLWITYEYPIK